MAVATTVVTANVLYSLGRRDAGEVLADVLAPKPDLVGLQEWYPWRTGLLRQTGPVVFGPGRRLSVGGRTGSDGEYSWYLPPLGGCVVGARVDRFGPGVHRTVLLSSPGRADREDRVFGLEPARLATVGIYRDRQLGRTVALVDYHLVSGVQSRGSYRQDRPRLVERHQCEVRRLARLVTRLLADGHVVHAVGDSNFDGLRLPGLTSAWEGRESSPGTLGPVRHVDDVHGPGPAEDVTLLTTRSDHRAVVVRRSALGEGG